MRLTDTIPFKVTGEGEDTWSFDLTMPALDVADEICDIMDKVEAERASAGRAMLMDTDAREKLTSAVAELEEGTDVAGPAGQAELKRRVMSDPTLVAALMRSSAMGDDGTSREIKGKLAGLVRPLCGPPQGLTLDDDRGGALTWDDVEARNPVYCREVLYQAAEAIYSHVQGEAQGLALKNSRSSSPSSTGGTTTKPGSLATPTSTESAIASESTR